MANNNSNCAAYLILNSLESGSKYGLEIIEHISNRTGGHYIMKKPTLYSALTRMEKKGLVSSSYWQTSDLGGKRHYYTITNAGKKELQLLEIEFKDASFDDIEYTQSSNSSSTTAEEESNSVVGWQESLFKTEPQKPTPKTDTQKNEPIENQIDIFSFQNQQANQVETEQNSYAYSSNSQNQSESSEDTDSKHQEKMEYYQILLEQQPTYLEADSPLPTNDDGVFLSDSDRLTTAQEQQNQRLYDSSNDLKKYRKRKSFAENQIEMSVEYESDDDREIQRERIENLKNSLLNFKQNKNQQILGKEEENSNSANLASTSNSATIQTSTNFAEPFVQSQNQNDALSINSLDNQENRLDDAVFITSRYDEKEIPVQRKITPPNIEIDVTDDNLPAPKRNTNLEPTYKDMMAKLFERKKEKEKLSAENASIISQNQNQQTNASQKVQMQKSEQSPVNNKASSTAQESYISSNYSDINNIVDYGTLQKYYAERGISFKEHKKTTIVRNHNTNFLQFISSVALLLLAGVGCAIIFGILAGINKLNPSSNFLFYTVPCLFLLYTIFTFIRYKVYESKKANLTYNGVVNLAVFILSLVVICVINILCGMQYEIIVNFLTSLLVPAYAMFLAFPCNYFIKKFLYKKYAK